MPAEHRFGFTVRRKPDDDSWNVHLPHQCDGWDIAGETGPWGPGIDDEGVPHATAVAELERFVAEAQVALAALRAEREVGTDG